MGGIRKPRKQYTVPRKRWDKSRIESEKKTLETYGLKNKRELRRFETILRGKRKNARSLLALTGDARVQAEKELFESIAKIGLLPRNSTIDDILSLDTQELLEKRLQTVVWRKNLAKTIKQARQFIVHGHIAVNGRKVTAPSYITKLDEVDHISYYKKPMQLEPEKTESPAELKKRFEEAALQDAEEAMENTKQETSEAE